jgi:hypothetical protein
VRKWILLVVVVSLSHAIVADAKDPPLLSLTMEHFRDTATVKDDALDTTATITTENGFVEHHGLLRVVWNDEFLRAFIDKRTGAKTFQVYEYIIYDSDGWRFYESANYQTPDGPQSVPATKIAQNVDCSTLGCTYTEHVAFTVDESLLRLLAAGYVAGKPAIWLYKFVGKSGPDYADGLSNAEIAGFLAKVDSYTTAHGIAAAIPKAEFGISLVPVLPTPQDPTRSGLLIVLVKDGSIAQRAGLLVGDIVTDFGPSLLKQPLDLQSAIAAAVPGSSIPVKITRGADHLTVTAAF